MVAASVFGGTAIDEDGQEPLKIGRSLSKVALEVAEGKATRPWLSGTEFRKMMSELALRLQQMCP
jgi:hypothetical protein